MNYVKPRIEQKAQNITLLTFENNKKLYLIGTAHVSAESVKIVEDTIKEVKPDTICVELDKLRYKKIMEQADYSEIDIIQIIRKKQLFFFIGQFILASFQRKISEQTGSEPGEEFKRAIILAKELGAEVVLADRNIGTTLKRAWRLTPFWHKIKVLAGLLVGGDEEIANMDIEKIKTQDAITNIISGFSDALPVTKEILIDERDAYLTSEIQHNLGEVTVAVVGAGHVPGMLKNFDNKISLEYKNKISLVPKPNWFFKILPWLISVLIIGVFIWGFFKGGREAAQEVVVFWILANGLLSALGCILALGHPLTAVAGFIAAPITSLNPTIGAGFVTAFVQTLLVKPRVKDFEQIHNKSLKFRQWWFNRVTKIFLVFLLSSWGSVIGTFVALPALTKFFKG